MPVCAVIGTIRSGASLRIGELMWLLNNVIPAKRRLHLGQLTFQLGDALLGVVLCHQQMVPSGSRGCSNIADARRPPLVGPRG